MSALFSTDKVNCWHEPINKLGSVAAVKGMLDNITGYQSVGISDSSVGIEADFYMAYFYEYPIVIINRNEHEVSASLVRFLGITRLQAFTIVETITDGLNRMRKIRDVMEIDYDELNDSGVVKNVWDYCTNGAQFDIFRCEQFQNLQINIAVFVTIL